MNISKRTVSLFLGALFTVSIPMNSFAKSKDTISKNFVYHLNHKDKTAKIDKIKTTKPIENLPQTINGYTVTEVSKSASLVKVEKIHDHKLGLIKVLGAMGAVFTFGLSIEASKNYIEKHGGQVVTYIPVYANINTVDLPKCIKIGKAAFLNCESLKTVNLPKLEEMGPNAFQNCFNLDSITIPRVEDILEKSFINCKSLKSLELPCAKVIYERAFKNCENLKNINILNCNHIGEHAFFGCKSLEKVILPKVSLIKSNVFGDCENLEEAYLPDCIRISKDAFENCYKLKKITIPESCEIEEFALPYDTLADKRLTVVRIK